MGPYDTATQWLLDQMHDPKVSLWRRIDIAKFLIETQPHEFNVRLRNDPDAPVVRIIIQGIGEATPIEPSCDKDPLRLN